MRHADVKVVLGGSESDMTDLIAAVRGLDVYVDWVDEENQWADA